MIGRTVLAALIAGLVAGLLAAVAHYALLDRMIMQAETYETAGAAAPAGHSHDHAAMTSASGTTPAAAEHDEHADHDAGWKPKDGFERISATVVAWGLAGAGFGLLLAGASLLSGVPLTTANALIWGVCGFIAVSLAPAAGLAPELPGMPAAELTSRQVWWVGTALATAAGIYLLAVKRHAPLAVLAALIVIALPHAIGAPQPAAYESAVPAGFAAAYVGKSLAVNALLWALIGLALGYILPRMTKELDHS